MTHRERRRRWMALYEDVQKNTAKAWADNFLADLTAGRNTYVPQSAI